MFFFHAVLHSQSYPILLQFLCSTDPVGEGLIALLPNTPHRIAPYPNTSKDFALLDNITMCDRVIGSFETLLLCWMDAMDYQTFLNELQRTLVPSKYTSCLNNRVPEGHVLFRKLPYAFLGMPFDSVPKDDFNSNHARRIIRRAIYCSFFFGRSTPWLFLLYYGKRNIWEDIYKEYKRDVTTLHYVQLRTIHFVDPDNGYNVYTPDHLGSAIGGFADGVADHVSTICDKV
jgi:hypothetical protein